eukprot:GHVS01089450.1.p1 GENE.GHVS01089450.1~~GHVS01089450.1.p1  ORF type:complete len:296 (+),score=36.62 GHVS01089450.1:228-1115(+)
MNINGHSRKQKSSSADLDALLANTMLSPIEVKYLFHEFGHTLHSLLSSTSLQHLSGTRGSVDYAEFPSELFEYFATQPQCLQRYARMHNTKQAPSPSLLTQFDRARRAFGHIDTAELLIRAMLDQAFYSFCPREGVGPPCASASPSAFPPPSADHSLSNHLAQWSSNCRMLSSPPVHQEEVLSEYSVAQLIGLPRPSKVPHLVHYGGTNYCYLFCKATAGFVWSESFHKNPWSRSVGQRLHQLLRNGSLDCSLSPILPLMGMEDGGKTRQKNLAQMPENIPLEPFLSFLSYHETF